MTDLCVSFRDLGKVDRTVSRDGLLLLRKKLVQFTYISFRIIGVVEVSIHQSASDEQLA